MIFCLDLEGVLVPEVWINVAERTGIEKLRLTTRDINDYDVLMTQRLSILEQNKLRLADIQSVIAGMSPLEGAKEFLDWLRERGQVIILSDTFEEFAKPLMRQLGWPAILCHTLETDSDGWVRNYRLRQKNQKREVVRALKKLFFPVCAIGDSYNDTAMLMEADHGILFHAPAHIAKEFSQFPALDTYEELKAKILELPL